MSGDLLPPRGTIVRLPLEPPDIEPPGRTHPPPAITAPDGQRFIILGATLGREGAVETWPPVLGALLVNAGWPPPPPPGTMNVEPPPEVAATPLLLARLDAPRLHVLVQNLRCASDRMVAPSLQSLLQENLPRRDWASASSTEPMSIAPPTIAAAQRINTLMRGMSGNSFNEQYRRTLITEPDHVKAPPATSHFVDRAQSARGANNSVGERRG